MDVGRHEPMTVNLSTANEGMRGQAVSIVETVPGGKKLVFDTENTTRKFMNETLNGKAIPLAHCLGIPLRLALVYDTETSEMNKAILLLGVIVDPESVFLGAYSCASFMHDLKRVALLSRSDGVDFDQYQAETLVTYCQTELDDLYDVPSLSAEGKVAAKKRVMAKLTPEAYAVYWEKYRTEKAESDEDWNDLKCPVTVVSTQHGAEVCGSCGAQQDEGSGSEGGGNEDDIMPLLRCGRCNKQMYCSVA